MRGSFLTLVLCGLIPSVLAQSTATNVDTTATATTGANPYNPSAIVAAISKFGDGTGKPGSLSIHCQGNSKNATVLDKTWAQNNDRIIPSTKSDLDRWVAADIISYKSLYCNSHDTSGTDKMQEWCASLGKPEHPVCVKGTLDQPESYTWTDGSGTVGKFSDWSYKLADGTDGNVEKGPKPKPSDRGTPRMPTLAELNELGYSDSMAVQNSPSLISFSIALATIGGLMALI